jgi:uncharacterized membrane protein YhaH (DUF805 family)
MSFTDAIRSCLQQYVGFTGRARRSEFWYFVLFTILVSIVATIIDRAILRSTGNIGIVASLANLALILPSLAVGARRLHDIGRTGWWQLLSLIPLIGTIVLIVFWVQDSQGDNTYGPSPKAVGGTVADPPYPTVPHA